jgi:type I restriction enzyme R subunit
VLGPHLNRSNGTRRAPIEPRAEQVRPLLGDETLRDRARAGPDCTDKVTADWTPRESVRAHLRVLVKPILAKHGFLPDKREQATTTVLKQAA